MRCGSLLVNKHEKIQVQLHFTILSIKALTQCSSRLPGLILQFDVGEVFIFEVLMSMRRKQSPSFALINGIGKLWL